MALGKVGAIMVKGLSAPESSCEHPGRVPQLWGGQAGDLGEQNPSPAVKSPSSGLLLTGCYVRKVVNISLGLLIAYLSIPVVINLISSRQVMNTSFNPLRIVNTYGAFGR